MTSEQAERLIKALEAHTKELQIFNQRFDPYPTIKYDSLPNDGKGGQGLGCVTGPGGSGSGMRIPVIPAIGGFWEGNGRCGHVLADGTRVYVNHLGTVKEVYGKTGDDNA